MNAQLQSQLYGIALAMTTAAGCLAYERLVKTCSFLTVGTLVMAHYLPFVLIFGGPWTSYAKDLPALKQNRWSILVLFISG